MPYAQPPERLLRHFPPSWLRFRNEAAAVIPLSLQSQLCGTNPPQPLEEPVDPVPEKEKKKNQIFPQKMFNGFVALVLSFVCLFVQSSFVHRRSQDATNLLCPFCFPKLQMEIQSTNLPGRAIRLQLDPEIPFSSDPDCLASGDL